MRRRALSILAVTPRTNIGEVRFLPCDEELARSTSRSYVKIDWDTVAVEEHAGKTGNSFWRTYQDESVRIRIVDYPVGFVSDHWCAKGHIIHMLQGEIEIDLKDGSTSRAKAGATLKIGEGFDHLARNASTVPARLLIVD